MDERALYVRDGDAYVGTFLTQGGWDPDSANGGAVLGLIGHRLDEVPTLVPMSLSRLTADIHRPVPLGRRLHVEPLILREGKKIQVLQLRLLADGVELVRVGALRVRDEPVGEGAITSTTDARPGDALVPPDEGMNIRELTPTVPGFLHAVDMRRAKTVDGSGMGCWVRLTAPVVAGSPISSSARVAAALDFANLIGMEQHPTGLTMINPDLSAHVVRQPVDEWIAITGETRFNTAQGRGVSAATFSDSAGVFAFASTSQILQGR